MIHHYVDLCGHGRKEIDSEGLNMCLVVSVLAFLPLVVLVVVVDIELLGRIVF